MNFSTLILRKKYIIKDITYEYKYTKKHIFVPTEVIAG